LFCPLASSKAAQQQATGSKNQSGAAKSTPKAADGHPDLNGIWVAAGNGGGGIVYTKKGNVVRKSSAVTPMRSLRRIPTIRTTIWVV